MRRVQVVLQRVFTQTAEIANFTIEELGFLWLVHDVEVSDDTFLGEECCTAEVAGDQAFWFHTTGQSMDSFEMEIQIVGPLETNLLRTDVAFVLDVGFLV